MALEYVPGNMNMFYDIAYLWNTVERYDNLDHIEFSPEFVSNFYHYAGVNLTEDVVLVRRKNGRLSAIGTLFFNRVNSILKATLSIMVHPMHRGQGIGKALLILLLKKAEYAGCKEVSCSIPEFRLYSLKFIEKFGFKNTRIKIKMQHESLDKIKIRKLPENLTLRLMNIEAEVGLWTILQNEIFSEDTSYTEVTVDSIQRIINHPNFIPDLAILGKENGTSIGYCVGWLYNPTTSSSNTALRIYALGVMPEFRRKGYGRALISEVLRRGLSMGYNVSELLVGEENFAAQQLYRELGFRQKYKLLDYEYEI
jgi:ribosomal protein S18 acetylase RimI-like enzyme